MKRQFYYAAFAAIATLTACSMNEIAEVPTPSGEVPINFAPMASKQTKAIPIDGAELQSGSKMLILKSYLTDDVNFNNFMTPPYKWIDGTLSFTNPDWVTQNTYYWPSNESFQLSFFSYYPNVNGVDGTTPIVFKDPQGYVSSAIAYPSFSFTVPSKVADQKDLIVASQMDQKRTITSGATSPAKVALQYKHILSQVRFTAQAAEPSNYSIRISGLKVKGAKNNATFVYDGTLNVGKWTNIATTTAEHIYRAVETQNAITTKQEVLPTGDADDVFMLLPQDIDKDFQIDVLYSIYSTDGQQLMLKDVWKTARMEKLERGKKYVYNLILPIDESLKPIEFTVDVTEWETEQNHDVKFTPYALTEQAKNPDNTAPADWANNTLWIKKYIADFALVYESELVNPNGHTSGSAYTHTIELNGEVKGNVAIDVSNVDFSNVKAGSKIIIDATAITKWNGFTISTVLPATGWTKTADLTSKGKITLTKI